jgi:ADP-heptose:LPS heptosyltransferase
VNIYKKIKNKICHILEDLLWEKLVAEGVVPIVIPRFYPWRDRRPPERGGVGSVLVWNIDSPGDFLWVTPALRALRQGYPRAMITLVCNRACRPLAETNRNVDRLIAIDPAVFYTGRGLVHGVPELAGERFDLMIVLEMGSRPADAARLIGRKLGVGYLVSTNLGILKSLPDHTLPPNRGEYWPSYFLRAVEHLGLPPSTANLEVATTPEDEAMVEAVLGPDFDDGRVAIGFHPYVAAYAMLTKKWPDDSFVELAGLLSTRRPTRFVLTGSPDEAGACEWLARRIRDATGAEVISTAGQLSLRAVIALYRRLGVVVTADTSALHLAAAAGVAIVTLFGSTDDRRIAQPSSRCVVLNQRLPCSPCHRYTDHRPKWPVCRFVRPKCMYLITPSHVAAEAENMLNTLTISSSNEGFQ